MKKIIFSYFVFFISAVISLVSSGEIRKGNSAAFFIGKQQTVAFENPYITDGLIAMYDGEWNVGFGKHDSNTLIWKDLIGNNDITYSVASLTAQRYWLENGFYQRESGVFYFQSAPSVELTYILKNGLPFTVEVVAEVTEIPSSSNSSLINVADGLQSSGLLISYNSNSIFCACKDSWGSLTFVKIGNNWNFMSIPFHCGMSMNGANENGYMFFKTLNGEIEGHSSSIKQNILTIDLTKMIIGGYAWSSITSRNHRGMVYCIRIYDRALDNEELSYNYQIDRERFGL